MRINFGICLPVTLAANLIFSQVVFADPRTEAHLGGKKRPLAALISQLGRELDQTMEAILVAHVEQLDSVQVANLARQYSVEFEQQRIRMSPETGAIEVQFALRGNGRALMKALMDLDLHFQERPIQWVPKPNQRVESAVASSRPSTSETPQEAVIPARTEEPVSSAVESAPVGAVETVAIVEQTREPVIVEVPASPERPTDTSEQNFAAASVAEGQVADRASAMPRASFPYLRATELSPEAVVQRRFARLLSENNIAYIETSVGQRIAIRQEAAELTGFWNLSLYRQLPRVKVEAMSSVTEELYTNPHLPTGAFFVEFRGNPVLLVVEKSEFQRMTEINPYALPKAERPASTRLTRARRLQQSIGEEAHVVQLSEWMGGVYEKFIGQDSNELNGSRKLILLTRRGRPQWIVMDKKHFENHTVEKLAEQIKSYADEVTPHVLEQMQRIKETEPRVEAISRTAGLEGAKRLYDLVSEQRVGVYTLYTQLRYRYQDQDRLIVIPLPATGKLVEAAAIPRTSTETDVHQEVVQAASQPVEAAVVTSAVVAPAVAQPKAEQKNVVKDFAQLGSLLPQTESEATPIAATREQRQPSAAPQAQLQTGTGKPIAATSAIVESSAGSNIRGWFRNPAVAFEHVNDNLALALPMGRTGQYKLFYTSDVTRQTLFIVFRWSTDASGAGKAVIEKILDVAKGEETIYWRELAEVLNKAPIVHGLPNQLRVGPREFSEITIPASVWLRTSVGLNINRTTLDSMLSVVVPGSVRPHLDVNGKEDGRYLADVRIDSRTYTLVFSVRSNTLLLISVYNRNR